MKTVTIVVAVVLSGTTVAAERRLSDLAARIDAPDAATCDAAAAELARLGDDDALRLLIDAAERHYYGLHPLRLQGPRWLEPVRARLPELLFRYYRAGELPEQIYAGLRCDENRALAFRELRTAEDGRDAQIAASTVGGCHHAGAFAALAGVLRSDRRVLARHGAVEGLRQLGDRRAVPLLQRVLADPDAETREIMPRENPPPPLVGVTTLHRAARSALAQLERAR